MPFSVRLDPETLALIERMAASSKQTRSWVVREAVTRYAAESEQEDTRTLYERMKPYIGKWASSGDGRLSEDTGRKFTEYVKEKARKRRAR